jgi:hypothetical protein
MADNLNLKDASGTSRTIAFKDCSTFFLSRTLHSDGTNDTPAGDVQARAIQVSMGDGTNSTPAGDNVSRAIIVQPTDGTRSLTIKASSTRAAATDTALVVRPMMGTNGTQDMPTMDAVARPGFVKITDGTNTMPTMDAVGRPGFQKITDGTNTMPTMDAVGRPGFVKITDGTNTHPTMDAVGRAGFVKLTDGTNTAPTMDAVARPGFQKITDGTTVADVAAASTGAALTNKALVVAQSPNTGATKGTARNQADTVTAIKSSGGVLRRLTVLNNQSAVAFIQLFDVASGSVVLGSTTPDWEIRVPGNSHYDIELNVPFGTAISIASTTTEGGAVGSATGVQVFWTRF